MIWKVEINNSYDPKQEHWETIELVGSSVLEEVIRERFFKIEYRNVQVWNEKEKEWKSLN